jgi:predicted transcriptional regulator
MYRKLTITVSSDWQAGMRMAAKAINQGITTGDYQGEVLNFESAAVFFSRLSQNRWNLLQALQNTGVIGVRELARRIGRDVRRVHDDITALLELGLIEKTDQGKLVCPYVDIHVDMHLQAA